MHDLIDSRKSHGVTAFKRHPQKQNPIKPAPAVEEIDETLDDLRELEFLADSFLTGLTQDKNSGSWIISGLLQEAGMLKASIRNKLHLIERSKRWSTNDDLNALVLKARTESDSYKTSLRKLYSLRGPALCAGDWQSPIYAVSGESGKNRLQDGIAEHVLDYKRDGHLEAQAYENAFVAEFASHLGSNNLKAYLTNNGMAAFSVALHWVSQEAKIAQTALAVLPMYFENIHLAQTFFSAIKQVNAAGEALLSQLNESQPSVVFCDTISNCGEVLVHDFQTIFDWAKTTERSVAIIIDATCSPTFLLPVDLLADLPENITVFIIESLAKYHQYGMDLVTGGIALLHTSNSLHSSFAKTRARFGANIVDASVGSLPQPNKLFLSKRLRRHSRNARLFAEQLESSIQVKPGVIESIDWQEQELSGHAWFRSSCLTLKFRPAFANIAAYKEFENELLLLAQKKGHPLALSTSFGFDVSRFYVTAPASVFEPPFLRVALGTETQSEIKTLISMVEEISALLAVRWKDVKAAPAPAEAKKQAPSGRALTNVAQKSGLKATVFSGEDAIKDYLCPANFAATPLIELPRDLNPFKDDGVQIMGKMVPLVPLMNIKSIPAFSMLNKAAQRGDLQSVKNIIESSSSNTVLSLSVIARLFGIDTTCAIVDHSIAPSLVRMLRLFGIEIFKHPAPGHELFGKMEPRSQRATDMGARDGWYNPNQYANPDNPEGFGRWLAPDLFAQTQGRLDVLSCALGTCGTMVGVARELRNQKPETQVVACCPARGEAVPGPREKMLLGDVAFPWQQVANARMELGAEESFAASIKLLRRGVMGGPSSGMNYAGLLKYLADEKASGRLQEKVSELGDELCAVFLCCDSPLPHIDEYYDALGDEYFPDVHDVPELKAD